MELKNRFFFLNKNRTEEQKIVYEVLFENEWNYVEVTCASLNCEYIENFIICSN